ncbi:MAG: hypothetical protein HY706_06880 [Candidatus Hydrogenedentes bacterium]|nr:hypothetical protein [Candidatus Hydrogenedentota bacterium]
MPAGDFYFAINATFRFIQDRFGEEALIRYWETLGSNFYAPLVERFRTGGPDAVAAYWREFFANEPGGKVVVEKQDGKVEIDVQDCPAIGWLRTHNREIVSNYCRHCHHVSTAIAEKAGLNFRLEGGGGTCHQTFSQKETPP